MAERDLDDLRAIEIILKVLGPLQVRDQVRVLSWVIDKLDLALDIKIAVKNARSKDRSYLEMAWEKVPTLMDSAAEFVAAAAPISRADRVLVIATFLQFKADDPESAILTGRDINATLRNMRLSVVNVTDCIYTLMKRSPSHMVGTGRVPNRKGWNGYRVTEPGIDYVYERIVRQNSDNVV
ncbi:MAG: hypothetical protein M3O30_01640 [Planctomycetota bacterium]|nr:hypothetical protein [Planctomycetota bacterium]